MTSKPDDALSRALDILQRYPVTMRKLADKPDTSWQPIETAPKDRFLLGWDGRYVRFIEWSEINGCWFEADVPVGNPLPVTHWMPIPDPPKA